MAKPTIYGPNYSTYVRSVRMALAEKGVEYDLVNVDMMKGEHKEPGHMTRHPFGKVPAFAHNGTTIYETDAILRYIDDAFPGAKLLPADLQKRTRANQIEKVADTYLYGPAILKVFLGRYFADKEKGPDETAIAAGQQEAEKALNAVEDLLDGTGPFAAGREFSLADMMLLPIIDYYAQMPEGQKTLPRHAKLSKWHKAASERPSAKATVPQM
ncbi:MAG TPA: glutathione S-transferase family protein [Dongiaceae bacterium]|jgi:glutathione S-transferase|nr:glutathione S-transferase family protein [Dongiaceae bacterium]